MGKQTENTKVSIRNMSRVKNNIYWKTGRKSGPVISVQYILEHTVIWFNKPCFLDFSELEYKILIKCLDCLLEIKLPHNKIRSILVLLETFHCEIAEIQEFSEKLKVKYAAVLKLIEDGLLLQNEQSDFVLLRISTVMVSSVSTITTITTEKTASISWVSL